MKKSLFSPLIFIPLSSFSSIPMANALEVFSDDKNAISLRGYLRLVYQNADSTDEITDAGSRIGFNFTRKIENDWVAGMTMEWQTNFEKNTNLIVSGGDSNVPQGESDDSLTSRLGYVHFTHQKWGSIGVGKQWSVYYDTVGGTDILNFFGGNGLGAFNLGTDGGLSASGRAEQAISWRKSYNDFSFGLQLQAQDETVKLSLNNNQLIDVATMGNGYALSMSYAIDSLTLSTAYLSNEIELNPIYSQGISADDNTAFAISAVYGDKAQGFYFAGGVAKTELHEKDNTNTFLQEATGLEAIFRYSFDKIALHAGINQYESDDSDNDYKMRYHFVSAEYNFDNKFGLIFIEAKAHDDINSDGTDGNDDTVIAIGTTVFL